MDIAQKIRDRLSEVQTTRSTEIERHRRALDEIDQHVASLEAALRIVTEIVADEASDVGVPGMVADNKKAPRPDNLPSMPEMIRGILADASTPLEPKELLARIRIFYWDGFESGDVGSTAWRMWKRGELMKEGSAYRLPQTNEAPQSGNSESASESEETDSLF